MFYLKAAIEYPIPASLTASRLDGNHFHNLSDLLETLGFSRYSGIYLVDFTGYSLFKSLFYFRTFPEKRSQHGHVYHFE